jgi:HPt (histidine-containing phosphotransfer) domain-containing protein
MGQNAPMIFAVTAFSSPDERDAIIASGMDGIVTKPISARAIEAVLRQIDSHGNIMAPLNVVKTNQTTIEDNLPIPDFEKGGVIETSRLDDMFGGMDKELQSRLLTAIESDLQNYFAQFEDGIAKADKDNIAKTHHALKGLCSGFGAHALLAKLEAIRENPQSSTSAKLAEARESLQFTVQALHQFLLR